MNKISIETSGITGNFQFYKNKNILIIGGNGFIGSHLTEKLIETGANVTIAGKKSKNYKNGVVDGKWNQFFINGNLKLQGLYHNGIRQGKQIYYYPDGTIYLSGFYMDDLKYGEWIYYNNEGLQDTIINHE